MKKNIFSILLLSGSGFLVGGLGYAYQILMLRLLEISEYAEFSSLLALINIFILFIGSFAFFLVKEIVKKEKHLSEVIKVVKKYTIYGTLTIGIVLLFSFPLIKSYLRIEDTSIILITISIIIISSFGLYQRAFFQSQKYFQCMAGYQSANAVIKLVAGVILVLIGFQAGGGIAGIFIAIIFLALIREIHIYKILKNKTSSHSKTIEKQFIGDIKNQKTQISQYLIFSLIIGLLSNLDIIIAKNLMHAQEAGIYASISVLAKFLIFLGVSIETVYYPQLVKEKVFPAKQILKISLYYLILTVGALGFFTMFGETILGLFKDGLKEYIGLIFPLLIYCGLLSYLSIIVKTLIAYEKYTINYILAFLIIVMIICIYSFANTPLMLAQIFAVFGIFGLGAGISTIYFLKK